MKRVVCVSVLILVRGDRVSSYRLHLQVDTRTGTEEHGSTSDIDAELKQSWWQGLCLETRVPKEKEKV